MLSRLPETLEGIRALEGLYKVLTEIQREKMKYAGLKLATSVIKYLLKAILYLEDTSVCTFRLSSSFDGSSRDVREKASSEYDHGIRCR